MQLAPFVHMALAQYTHGFVPPALATTAGGSTTGVARCRFSTSLVRSDVGARNV